MKRDIASIEAVNVKFRTKNSVGAYAISHRSGATGLQRLPSLKYYNIGNEMGKADSLMTWRFHDLPLA